MKKELENHGIGYNISTSLPIIGTAARFLLDYTRMGIDQYGYFLGTIRGGLVGFVMFALMLFLSEAIPLGWGIIRYYFDIHYVQPVMAAQRGDAVELGIKKEYRFGPRFELDWLDPGHYLLRDKVAEPTVEEEGR